MKHLTEETFQLIKQLYETPGLLEKILVNHEKQSLILEKIEKSSEPLTIQYLLPYVITNRNENSLAAARIIHNLIDQLSVSDLAVLDEEIRLNNSYYLNNVWGWNKIRPDDIIGLDYLHSYQVSVLGICSSHNNGFVREKAITEFSNIWTGKELPFLLIRLNDWVPNVRQAALTAVTARLQPSYAFYFVDCLPLFTRLSKQNRIDQSSIVILIKELIRAESSRPALKYGLKVPDLIVRRACFQIALDVITTDSLEIIELGSMDEDNLIRLWSVQKLRAINEIGKVDHLLETIRTDSYMQVRREALRIYIEKYPEQALEELRRVLLDSHSSMRSEARYQITKTNKMDFAAFYRDNLVQGNAIYSAICGLGETGTTADDTLIEPYVNHKIIKIRRLSIKTLAKLNPQAYTELFMQALSDPSASVSREAAKALEHASHLLIPERMWNKFENATHQHVKASSLFLIAHLPKWESIFYLLKAASSGDEIISKMAYLKIDYWVSHFNTSFIMPTDLQKTRLSKLLVENGDNLKIQTRREIEFIVKSM
jgi:HEAT repeat protein